MSYWNWFKWNIRNILGMKQPFPKEFFNVIKEKQAEQKGYVPEPTPITRKCDYIFCKKRLSGLVYKCKYCGGTFCEKHRLPEKHDCDDPKLPKEMKRGSGIRQLSESRFSEAMAEEN